MGFTNFRYNRNIDKNRQVSVQAIVFLSNIKCCKIYVHTIENYYSGNVNSLIVANDCAKLGVTAINGK